MKLLSFSSTSCIAVLITIRSIIVHIILIFFFDLFFPLTDTNIQRNSNDDKEDPSNKKYAYTCSKINPVFYSVRLQTRWSVSYLLEISAGRLCRAVSIDQTYTLKYLTQQQPSLTISMARDHAKEPSFIWKHTVICKAVIGYDCNSVVLYRPVRHIMVYRC